MTNPQIIPISEDREPVSNHLERRQVLILGRDNPLFVMFWPNGATELLDVSIAAGKAESHYVAGATMKALVEAFLDFHADLREQAEHEAFLNAQKAAEALTGPTEDQPQAPAMFDTCSMEGCMASPKPGYHVCEEHYQATREAADNAEPVSTVQRLPGGAMAFYCRPSDINS